MVDVRQMATYHPTRSRRFGCFPVAALGIAILVTVSFVMLRVHSVRPVLRKVAPGMTYTEVSRFVPSRFVQSKRLPRSQAPRGTYLVVPNADVVSYMSLRSVVSLLHPAEKAEVYFNADDQVVGIRYSSESGRWAPRWESKTRVGYPDKQRGR